MVAIICLNCEQGIEHTTRLIQLLHLSLAPFTWKPLIKCGLLKGCYKCLQGLHILLTTKLCFMSHSSGPCKYSNTSEWQPLTWSLLLAKIWRWPTVSCLFSVICTALLQRWMLILNLTTRSTCVEVICVSPKSNANVFFLLLALYYDKEKPHPLDVLCLGGVANEIEVSIKGGCFSNEALLKTACFRQWLEDKDESFRLSKSSVMQGYSSRVEE